MRKILMIGAMIALITPHAFAWDYIQNGSGQQIGDSATGVQNNLGQGQSQTQGQHQNAVSNSTSRSSSSSAANVRSSTTSAGGAASNGGVSVSNNGGNVPRQTASAYAPSMMTVNPCGTAISGGAQTGLFGFSFGGSSTDKMCQIAMYSSNPVAFQWACRKMDGFRQAAADAGTPCAMDRPVAVDVIGGPLGTPVSQVISESQGPLGYQGPCLAPDRMMQGVCRSTPVRRHVWHAPSPPHVVKVVATQARCACEDKK